MEFMSLETCLNIIYIINFTNSIGKLLIKM